MAQAEQDEQTPGRGIAVASLAIFGIFCAGAVGVYVWGMRRIVAIYEQQIAEAARRPRVPCPCEEKKPAGSRTRRSAAATIEADVTAGGGEGAAAGGDGS